MIKWFREHPFFSLPTTSLIYAAGYSLLTAYFAKPILSLNVFQLFVVILGPALVTFYLTRSFYRREQEDGHA